MKENNIYTSEVTGLFLIYNEDVPPDCPDSNRAMEFYSTNKIFPNSRSTQAKNMPNSLSFMLKLLGHNGKFPVAIFAAADLSMATFRRFGLSSSENRKFRIYTTNDSNWQNVDGLVKISGFDEKFFTMVIEPYLPAGMQIFIIQEEPDEGFFLTVDPYLPRLQGKA